MRIKCFIACSVFLAAAMHARGQGNSNDSVMKGSTIEVLQKYKPQVKNATKPGWLPQLPPADTTRSVLNYEVPQQTLFYSFTSGQLRPLALGKDSIENPFPNYIKAGAGNLSTLFLDAGIGTINGENYETALHLHHISQKGPIQSQQNALSGFEAEGVLRQDKNVWHAIAEVERNQLYYYGYDHSLYNPNTDSIKQTYTSVKLGVDLKSKFTAGSKEITFTPAIVGSVYEARFSTSETNFGLTAPFRYKIDETLDAVVTFSTGLSHLSRPVASTGNNIAELQPGVILQKDALSGKGLIGFAVGKGGNIFVLPDIVANYAIENTSLMLSGGWQATVTRNTYEELTTENPYLSNNYVVKQSRKDEIFANVTGSYGNHLTYTVRASWWNFPALPTYLNIPNDFQQFTVAYDNVSALSLYGGARYTDANKWSAGLNACYYNYYEGSLPQVWELPKLKIKGDVAVKLIPKLTLTGYVSSLSGIYARNLAGKAVVLNPVFDIGINGEYQLVSRLNAFLQVSNLLNNKYQRWQGYDAYGLNIYGGLRLKF